jgi:hypothetical protein
MRRFVLRRLTLFAAGLLLAVVPATAQVTTATLYGIVVDESGAVLPGATVTVTHEGTAMTRTTVTNESGEFALSALPIGPYRVRIELEGFKAQVHTGLSLASAQTVRQTYRLELGQIAEDVTVEGVSPLVKTASSEQLDTIGPQQLSELPSSRRNVTGLLRLAPGVDPTGGHRGVRFNGVGKHGAGITVDGTDANSNPEGRGISQYGGENYIDVMSIEAVEEVQLVRGIMPAEYGGIVGGQVNLISRSGTNSFHGSVFENYIGESLNARDVFLSREEPKPPVRFNQFGGSIGGPILRNRAFFFGTYEGYREEAGTRVQGDVPTPELREQILAALPFPETEIVLDTLPLPTEPIDEDVGFFVAARNRERRENHVVAKGDVLMLGGGRLSLTYTRMRPFSLIPSIHTDGANDRVFLHAQDRVAATFVHTFRNWVSESRFGYNRNEMDRLDRFFEVQDPTTPETNLWGRRIGLISVAGLFATPTTELWDMNGTAYSVDQKMSRVIGNHLLKLGIRWVRQTGDRSNPENPVFGFQNKADLLANIPNQVRPTFGSPPHKSHMDELGGFIQDDWRVNNRLVFNLGLRYDYYGVVQLEPTGAVPVEIVNLERPSDLRLMDFGAPRPADKPYEPDGWVNLGPRAGVVWTIDDRSETVLRAGSGVLYSPQMPGMVRQGAANPLVPFRISWGSAEAAERGLRWPAYNDDMREIVEREATASGQRGTFSLLDPSLQNPYTIQSTVNLQRAMGPSLMAEIGYQRVDGRKLVLQRQLALAIDRETGRRINPDLGSPGGYYIDNNHTSEYNALQLSVRKRFSNHYSFDLHYTYGGGTATSGGDIGAYYQGDYPEYAQDFWNPEADRGPLVSDARHGITADVLFEVPFSSDNRLLAGMLGGWQIAGIYSYRSGEPLRITQPSAIPNSRPDYTGGDPVLDGWRETRQYLNPDAFSLVPLYPDSRATVRPGDVPLDLVRGPGSWTVDLSLAKSFSLRGGVRLQVRADAFNALNHPNYGGISTSVTSSTFGQIRSTGSPRQIQLGARLTF